MMFCHIMYYMLGKVGENIIKTAIPRIQSNVCKKIILLVSDPFIGLDVYIRRLTGHEYQTETEPNLLFNRRRSSPLL
jgi:hypothetical protein